MTSFPLSCSLLGLLKPIFCLHPPPSPFRFHYIHNSPLFSSSWPPALHFQYQHPSLDMFSVEGVQYPPLYNHLSLASQASSPKYLECTVPLVSSFLLLSILVTSKVKLRLLSSLQCLQIIHRWSHRSRKDASHN